MLHEFYNGNGDLRSDKSLSTGMLLDLKKTVTIGASFYGIYQKVFGLGKIYEDNISQIYHLSFMMFKEKKVQLQPYIIFKKDPDNKYLETGAYITYKCMSVHLGNRNIANGVRHLYYLYNDRQLIAGINFTYKKMKLGYTSYFEGDIAQELFLSFNFLNKSSSRQRSLMLN